MRVRFGSLFVLLAVLMMVVPAHADLDPIDPFNDVSVLLDLAEFEKMTMLQDTPLTVLGSPISPDDSTVLVGNYRYSDSGAGFMNIRDGSIVPLQQLQLPDDVSILAVAATELVWFDDHTLGQLILDLFEGVYILAADSTTGEISLTPTGQFFIPASISPDGSKVLVLEVEGVEEFALKQMLEAKKLPFSQPLPETTYKAPDLRAPTKLGGFYAHTEHRWATNEETVSLSVIDLNAGSYTPLLTVPEDSLIVDWAWSNDGSKLALIRDTSELGEDINARRLVDAFMLDALGELSPDDNPFLQYNVIDVFDFATGNLQIEAIRSADGNGDVAADIGWSTDGSRFFVEMWHPAQIKGRRFPSYIFPDRSYLRFYDSQANPLSVFDAPETNAPDGATVTTFISPDELIINATVGTTNKLFYYNQGSGEYRAVSSWDGWYYGVLTTRTTRELIYTFSSFTHAPEIYRSQWNGEAISRMTWGNAEVEKLNNIRVDTVSFTLRNGAVRNGYLIQPAGAAFPPSETPLVVWQEGGPRAPFVQRWATNVENPYNLLPNFGIPVLFVPLPGRLGFGPEFLNALADGKNFGQIDIDEMAEIVDQLVTKNWAAEGRVGITGCSYGGYFATQSITRHQQRYGAANAQCSLLVNQEQWHLGLGPLMGYLEGVKPSDDPVEFAADSPYARASAVRTPTLMFHGVFDFLPVKFAIDFHDQIEIQGYKARIVVFDWEGHGLVLSSSQLRAGQEQLLWFRQYLYGETRMPEVSSEPAIQTLPTDAVAPTYLPQEHLMKFMIRPF